MAYLSDRDRLFRFNRMRVVYFVISVIAFGFTEMGRFVYRPFKYRNEIYDYGLADSVGNLLGIVVQIFLTMAVLNSNKITGIRLIVFLTSGYVLYEIVQPYLPKGVFDMQDIWATLIGGSFACIVFLILHKFENRIEKNRETDMQIE